MAEEKETTNWRQWRIKTNLGTLASIVVAVIVLVWQGGQIRAQIDANSAAVDAMAMAVEELSATVGLTIELDQRTNQLFTEIEHLRSAYSDQAWATTEITLNTERVNSLDTDLQDLDWRVEDLLLRASDEGAIDPWRVDDLAQRVSVLETYPDLFRNTVDDLEWRTTDLVRQVGELWGITQGTDYQWDIDELDRRLRDVEFGSLPRWEFDDQQWRLDDIQAHLDSLFGENDEIRQQIDELWDYINSL
jgi:outer membrane murein-binding lipoprotein Lpp